jgi:multidrug resistance efflux pump
MSFKLTNRALLVLALLSLATFSGRCMVSDQIGVSTIEPEVTPEGQVGEEKPAFQVGLEFEGFVAPRRVAHLAFGAGGVLEEIAVMEGEQVKAGQELVRLDATAQGLLLQQAQVALDVAELRLSQGEGEQLLLAKEVERARIGVALAQAQLDAACIVAPFDGTVVEILLGSGEFASAGQSVVVLATLDDLVVEVEFDEWSIVPLEKNQAVNVRVLALNNAVVSGKIDAISEMPTFKPSGETVYATVVALDTTEEHLAWGMTVEVGLLP